MGITQLHGLQVKDGSVQRQDLDVLTPGSAVIRKLIPGNNVTLTSTGADPGTGDVTINSGPFAPFCGGIVVGRFYDNSIFGTSSGTLAGAADRMDLAAFYTNVPLTIDQIGVSVSTAVAGANVKLLIYEAGADRWPSTKLYESAAVSAAVAAYAFASLAFTFQPNKLYYVGVRYSATPTIRTILSPAALSYGLSSSTGTTYFTLLRRTLAFATAAPSPWAFLSTDLANAAAPSIRFRAA